MSNPFAEFTEVYKIGKNSDSMVESFRSVKKAR